MYVGIDVSKDRLDVHVQPIGEAFWVTRDDEGLSGLIDRLRGYEPVLIVAEATGGFETTVAAALAGAGLPVAVVNPHQVRSFARSIGRLAKTDRLDAEVIARFAEAVQPTPKALPDEDAQLLGELVARRRQLVDMIVAEGNRQRRLSSRHLRRRVARHIRLLERELARLERDIDDTIQNSPVWRATEDLLTAVPGVGKTTARTLIAEMPELGHVGRREIAALAGVAPMNRDSGLFRGRRMIRGGRRTVRTALYMAALVATRHNPEIRTFYRRLTDSGKPKKLAITACMRKLITILNAIIRDAKPWQTA